MIDKKISFAEAAAHIHDGMTIMVGGFLANGTPEGLIEAIVSKGVKELTIICNDTALPDKGVGKLIVSKQVKRIVASHVGTNPETGRQINANEIESELVPQGTLAERIRCGGCGLGGVLTATGIGTEVEAEKQKITINQQEYLLELPLRADIALIYGTVVDKFGNIHYTYTQRNFNPMMAMAANLVICEAGKIVEIGDLEPNNVMTPGIFVDYIVGG